jgi:hypothetical protein
VPQAHIFCALLVQLVSTGRGCRAIPETGSNALARSSAANHLQPINLLADDAADGSSRLPAYGRIEECQICNGTRTLCDVTLKRPKVRELLEKHALQPADAMSTSELARLYASDAENIRELGITIADPTR